MSTALTQNVDDPAQLEPLTAVAASENGERVAESGNSAFFYGTLMHPAILRRVIANDGAHLEICPAILFDCDYPAVVPSAVGKEVLGKDLEAEDQTVRGVVVIGLTARDIELLDTFEGDEYRREAISAVPITAWSSLDDAKATDILSKSSTLPDPSSSPKIPAFVYIWEAPLKRLRPELWNYDGFVKDHLERWVDRDPTDEEQKDQTRRRIDMAGVIVAPAGGEGYVKDDADRHVTSNGSEDQSTGFGHPMLNHFGFAPGYVNLNNGSYGAVPIPVTNYCIEIDKRAESRPDVFYRPSPYSYRPMLKEICKTIAKMLHAEPDECVLVPNATHGINTVLRNFQWEEGDILVEFTTTYMAIRNTLKAFADVEPHPTISTIPLTFPTTHAQILKDFRKHLEGLPDTYDQKVVVVIDSTVSTPGMALPWEEMVQICKEFKAWSIIDGAHGIGMSQINLSKAQPDFWVSNCHKWLFTKRGCAVLYVPRRNQHLIRATLPVSWSYVSPPGKAELHDLFEYTGTVDMSPFLSVKAALDFRNNIGGELKIQAYCNSLAREGGKRMAEILGTENLDPNDEYIGPMTNVRLPLDGASILGLEQIYEVVAGAMTEMARDYDCFASVFVHNGQFWVRASAQVWNDISDFEYVANALKKICQKRQKVA